ncbi:MAG: ABC transporter permease subunit, partial [Streptococcus orisratti]|nr:ABC transporter permease subunit [Streptococcus orisratti]
MTDRLWQLLVDSFVQILVPGLLVTIPLTILSFSIGLLIAIGTALVQIAGVPVLKQLARFYIWIIRGTPLLVQLYVIFYGLPSLGLVIDAFP